MTPSFRLRSQEAATLFIGAARCAVCRRTFMTPIVTIPLRAIITTRGPDNVQQHLTRWACAWMAHEAGRP